MYGTIPIAASFSRHGMRHDWLAAFMMSSVLLNPQLLFYSTALGGTAMAVRLVSCAFCGIFGGLAVHFAYGKKPVFEKSGAECQGDRYFFLTGVLLSALFQRYVPSEGFAKLFGKSNEGFGVLMAASLVVGMVVHLIL